MSCWQCSTHRTDEQELLNLVLLDSFRGRNYQQAETDEREGNNLTRNILIHGFGENSENLSQFSSANSVGEWFLDGMSERLFQQNFEDRLAALAAMLRGSLAELELMMPEPEIAWAYQPGDEYQFYRDLKTIVGLAAKDLFIIDSYLATELFDVYMENASPSVVVRVLTDRVADPLRLVAEKFARRGGFELRSSNEVHDRVIFVDDRCWVVGQSIKDAAKKKPTYIVEHSGAATMKGIYEPIWTKAVVVVKS